MSATHLDGIVILGVLRFNLNIEFMKLLRIFAWQKGAFIIYYHALNLKLVLNLYICFLSLFDNKKKLQHEKINVHL